MVALDVVKASNARVKNLPAGLVALFVGGTSGIGESTLQKFCLHAVEPRIYIVGRNEQAARRIISEGKKHNSKGHFTFIQKDVTLLKNVDEVCSEIKSREQKLNLLFMTSGTMSLKGRDETTEGLDRKLTTNYYARLRFTTQLLPLLLASTPLLSRVVSVLAPGEETKSFNLNDLDLKRNFTLRNAANHAITMTDFAFEELARRHETVSFVHAYPGTVKTGFMKETGALVQAGGKLATLLLSPYMTSIEESGERHLFAATSGMYPAKYGFEESVELKVEKAVKGSNGVVGSGAYLIGADGEFRANEKVLVKLRGEGARDRIWEHTEAMFKRIRG